MTLTRLTLVAISAFYIGGLRIAQAAQIAWNCEFIFTYGSSSRHSHYSVVIDTDENTVRVGNGVFGGGGENVRSNGFEMFADTRSSDVVVWGTRSSKEDLSSTSTLNMIDGQYNFTVFGEQHGHGHCERINAVS